MLIEPPKKKIKIVARASDPQVAFINSEHKFPLFLGGFGAGKTEALISRAIKLKLKYPQQNVAYYLPTYDLISQIGYPRVCAKLDSYNLKYSLNKTEKIISIFGKGKLIFRTLDNPEKIVGFEVAHSLVDELDTLSVEHAKKCWEKILSRNRQKLPGGGRNTIAVGTTPEGFRFVYQTWGKDVKKAERKGYVTYQAATYSNQRNLPSDYIENLRENYDDLLFDAYVNGKYVNLKTGRVYRSYDREVNSSKVQIRKGSKAHGIMGDTLHIGMDFNVDKMAAVVHVIHGDCAHAVKQYFKLKDTPHMIETIKKDFSLDEHDIYVYPDSSGISRKTNSASTSDIQLLQKSGFKVRYNSKNPAVADRVLSVNVLMKNAKGEIRYFVNPETCPDLAESFEQQAWKEDGTPDKTGDFDHLPDAAGYFVSYKFPIRNGMKARQVNYSTGAING